MKKLPTAFIFLFYISSLSAGDLQAFKNWNVLKDILIPIIEGDESIGAATELAANNVNAYAQTVMGIVRQHEGSASNSSSKYKEAGEWLERAIQHGSPIAHYILAIMYEKGQLAIPYKLRDKVREDSVVDVKYHAALESYKIAFYQIESILYLTPQREDIEILNRLSGQIALAIARHLQSTWLQVDELEPQYWFVVAAEKGNAEAMIEVAEIVTARPTDENKIRGFQLYEKAAILGNPKAQERLAWCFEYGHGAEIDLSKAEEWCQKAVENGNERAVDRLHDIRLKIKAARY